jgi:hypothetical protein
VLGFLCLQSDFLFLFDGEIFQFVYCLVCMLLQQFEILHIHNAIDMEPLQQSGGN